MHGPAQEGERNFGAALAMLEVLDSTARRWRRAMKWITRERPVIDRIACPWLIARFIDKEPEFLFVPPDQVLRAAAETGAIPYDVPGVEFTHVGEGCSFDAFVAKYGLDSDPAIVTIAAIVRGGRYGPARSDAAIGRAVGDLNGLARPQPRRSEAWLRHL